MQRRVKFEHAGYTWQGRFMFGLLAVLWLVISLTFTGVLLTAGALLALVVGVRLAWLRRRSRHGRPIARSRVVDGQYVVLERQRDSGQDWMDG